MRKLIRQFVRHAYTRSTSETRETAKRLLPSFVALRIRRLLSATGAQGTEYVSAEFLRSDPDRLHARLWGGYARYALADLEALRLSPASHPAVARSAAAALARYYAASGDHAAALGCIAFIRAGSPRQAAGRRLQSIEINSLLALNRIDDARYLLERAQYPREYASDVDALWATLHRIEAQVGRIDEAAGRAGFFDALNRPLISAGFAGLSADADSPLALSTLASRPVPPLPSSQSSSVSVLMAAYNAEANIEAAMRSVLNQTWRNLELIVVDDASTDDTALIAERLAGEDSRVKLIRQAQNGGAYVARNAALAQATGRYVVVNDADDWAHPQKIEAQVCDMDAHNGIGANMTFRLRVDNEFLPVVRLDSPYVRLVHNDFSALMATRGQVLSMGGWDRVRFGGDTEFKQRLQANADSDPIRRIHQGVPLSLALFDDANLTGASATSLFTYRFGARCEYQRSLADWHAAKRPTVIERTSQTDPFPIPTIAYSRTKEPAYFDIVLVSDFRLPSEAAQNNLNYLSAFSRAGYSVAYLQWSRYDIEPRNYEWPRIANAVRQSGVVPLVHGERINCNLLLILHPPTMMWQPDHVPEIICQLAALLVSQLPQRPENAESAVYDPVEVQARLVDNFGVRGCWLPASPFLRQYLGEVALADEVWHEPWPPMLDYAAWHREPNWRGDVRGLPVLGRHADDRWIKWPGSQAATEAAYNSESRIRVGFMGRAHTAKNLLEYTPANWEIVPADGENILEFLSSLDIFIYIVNERHGGGIEHNMMAAMAAGLPLICSPSFRETFGDAALYANPDEVYPLIKRLWQDESHYLAVAHRGQAFAARHCDVSQIVPRLERLLASRNGQTAPFHTPAVNQQLA
jgi:glycosyltransferase involved in cell wall biosynthesis